MIEFGMNGEFQLDSWLEDELDFELGSESTILVSIQNTVLGVLK